MMKTILLRYSSSRGQIIFALVVTQAIWGTSYHQLQAQPQKPVLRVVKDGFPGGHSTPEGAACDLARAFIKHDVPLFKATCIPPFGRGSGRQSYEAFLKQVTQSMAEEAKRSSPSPGGPKSIGKVFSARNLSHSGPASYAYSVLGFKDVKFVDIGVLLQNGKRALNRTLVIQAANGNWYVHPLPASNELLSEGLNDETASTKDFSQAYAIKK